jgi:ATP adenylyltransferase
MEYIKGHGEQDGCLFCDCIKQEDGPQNLILHRGESAFVMLNRYPYTNGHMMVVPIAHAASIDDLDDAALGDLMRLSAQAIRVLRAAYEATAFNLGANIGEPAGAGIIGHVHLHIVPRWDGDTNFMATTAETRVIPEALEHTYDKLRNQWGKIG